MSRLIMTGAPLCIIVDPVTCETPIGPPIAELGTIWLTGWPSPSPVGDPGDDAKNSFLII